MDYQKLCKVENRRVLCLLGIIAFCVIGVQFLSLPYESLLLSLFPVGNSSTEEGDSSPKPKPTTLDKFSASNNSNSSDLSVAHGVGSSAEGPSTGDETILSEDRKGRKGKLTDDSTPDKERGPNDSLQQDEDTDVDDEDSIGKVDLKRNSSDENVSVPYERPIFIPPTLPPVVSETGSPLEQMNNSYNNFSSDSSPIEDTSSALDKVGFRNNSPLSLPPAVPPIASSNSLTFPRELDGNLSTSIISSNSNMTSSGKKATDLLPKDQKPNLVGSSPTASSQSSTPGSTSVKKGNWQRPLTSVTSLSEMSLLLRQNRASSSSMKPQWSSVRDEEILSAKSQIENAPIVKKNRELYAPLFRNISMFKRSYELMEQILKVYIYKEGAKPIFHQPELKGIYASEGWFMKQIEANKQFVVKDPRDAHLFYLPFSSRRLRHILYLPKYHSRKKMVEYLKNYMDLIAANYPFWNRSGGADHFLVACHDLAPAVTKHHMGDCIRSLCNADVKEGFTLGKDVSLPETNVLYVNDPLRDLGGKPPSQRQILAFFAGSMHGYLRRILLQYWENKDPDMKIFGHMGRGSKNKMNYIQYMKSSKYCICAKGYEVSSPRVVEAIFYECVPVIISDNYVPPFFEVLNWEGFAVFVPEKDIPYLKNILLSIPDNEYLKMQMRVRKVQQHFLWYTKPVKSYELMEQTLKVYIYKEGKKPVFHQPELRGIYASEGWFMRHMEANKKFVVKDPREAHLFYLPFSTRQLEHSLYVPNSHSRANLVEYLKNYLDIIAAKYPFWNRTDGADHFLVACHDWAPSETKRYMSHCIRALCNADVKEGFIIGKDVSLPETNVRSWKDPLKDLGGRPPSQRQTLAFFAGSMHGYLRPILLQHWENKDPDMKIFGKMGRGKKNKMNYIQYMKSSKYCICAKGYEVNSPRVVESIFYECVPVIISDNYVPPFFEVLNWESFAVFVAEKDIPNLKNILLAIPQEKYLHMQMRVRKVQQHFLWHTNAVKYDIFYMILHSIWYNRVFELNPR